MDHQTRLIEKGYKRQTIWLSPVTQEALDAYATKKGLTKAYVARFAISLLLKSEAEK
jgi:predicted DNA-binding protein